MLYRGFATQEELDAQYALERVVPDAASYAGFYEGESGRARGELEHHPNVPYGPTLAEHADVYPAPGGAARGAPVLVYLHGGYWRKFSSKEFGFVARGPASRGVATVVVNYALCPVVTVGEIVRQARAALAWTYKNAAGFGGDAGRIHVAGHSAGGHLAAMLLLTDWEGEYGLPRDAIKGAAAISGLFDLAPFPYTFLQPKLQLTWGEVMKYSPILLVVYGENETDEFVRQSAAFHAAWTAKGLEGDLLPLPGKHPYDVIDGLLDAESPLCAAILGRMGVR